VLGGLAEFERDLIRTRTGEGRERAKARGVKMGRKPMLRGNLDEGRASIWMRKRRRMRDGRRA
jgi:DNA invertase Pin-like site-specific DNA recombinase